ncbi:MAG: tetratricopeptide repeat protein [Actinomycetota bacterium]
MNYPPSLAIFVALYFAVIDFGISDLRQSKAALASPQLDGSPTALTRGTGQASKERLIAECRSCPDGPTQFRGGQSDRIPYIIAPRRTYLLSNQPTFRWNRPIQGAKSYTVTLISLTLRKPVWQKQNVTDNTLAYPAEQPPLEAGVEYSLEVKVEGGPSSIEEEANVSFRLLAAQDADYVRSASALIFQQQLSEETTSLLLAYLYSGYYLRAEAIELLEPLAAKSQKPAVHRLLGDIYQQIGLPSQAENYYLKAVKFAGSTQNLEELAAAQARLGEVYLDLGDKEQAIATLKQALELYQKLNNQQRVKQLQERLKKLGA